MHNKIFGGQNKCVIEEVNLVVDGVRNDITI